MKTKVEEASCSVRSESLRNTGAVRKAFSRMLVAHRCVALIAGPRIDYFTHLLALGSVEASAVLFFLSLFNDSISICFCALFDICSGVLCYRVLQAARPLFQQS